MVEIRRYVVLDEYHQPRISPFTHAPHIFNNRWPRDAALKAATKDDMYASTNDEDNTFCMIYLREVPPELNGANYEQILQMDEEEEEQGRARIDPNPERRIVHVYRGRRQWVNAPEIEKFRQANGMWVGEVEKVREEKLFARHAVLRPQHHQ